MCYQYNVEFLVCRGLGPQWETKVVFQAYDDVDADVPEYVIRDWAKNDAKQYLSERMEPGYPEPIYVDTHSA